MTYKEWYDKFSKENIDPNELSANAFGTIVWDFVTNTLNAKLKYINKLHWATVGDMRKQIADLQKEIEDGAKIRHSLIDQKRRLERMVNCNYEHPFLPFEGFYCNKCGFFREPPKG